ncbi:UNVERIFIED_CONTAM: hypothetical protein PYX00_006205 [Menopon gallinae]|uniref:ATP synthase mitochondrial F1 complex assembly factor 2 n=1 Tax=Menopon gallinae TaxID=328185 RepID=A0AAW2HVN3_9NEOP
MVFQKFSVSALSVLSRSLLLRINESNSRTLCPIRCLATRKRFYRKTDILQNDGHFEITLDQKKLKTPKGNLFYVKSEPLALAVAAEWDAQKTNITPSTMHLTGLTSTVIDNPNKLTKEDMVKEIIGYLHMDTVLFYSHEADELLDLQKSQWTPIISWFRHKFNVNIDAVQGIAEPVLEPETKEIIEKYLMSYDAWAIHGFKFVIEALKSVILGISCCERFISVEKAVLLSRLEEEYQGKRWGRIEWSHELNQQDLQARVAAGILFIYANSSSAIVKSKTLAV